MEKETEKLERLKDDLKWYQDVYRKAKRDRRLQTAEGAQMNIDKVHDEIKKLKKREA